MLVSAQVSGVSGDGPRSDSADRCPISPARRISLSRGGRLGDRLQKCLGGVNPGGGPRHQPTGPTWLLLELLLPACAKSPYTNSAFQSSSISVLDTTYFFARWMVWASGTCNSSIHCPLPKAKYGNGGKGGEPRRKTPSIASPDVSPADFRKQLTKCPGNSRVSGTFLVKRFDVPITTP
jgi:hypothetical protein